MIEHKTVLYDISVEYRYSVNDSVIDSLLLSLHHLDELEGLRKLFSEELDGSYIEEMRYRCTELLNAAFRERDSLIKQKGANENV